MSRRRRPTLDARLTAREQEWHADAARLREAAVQAAGATTEAAATLAAKEERWADDRAQAVAAAVAQTQADADEQLASRERHWKAETELTTERARLDAGNLREAPEPTIGNVAPAATEADVHATLDLPEPDTKAGLDLRGLDGDVQLEDVPAMDTIQAWLAEDTGTQEAVADQPKSSHKEPDASSATGWRGLLRRPKRQPPSAKGPRRSASA